MLGCWTSVTRRQEERKIPHQPFTSNDMYLRKNSSAVLISWKQEDVVEYRLMHVEIRIRIEKGSCNKFLNAGMNQHIQCIFGMQNFVISGIQNY